MPTARSGRRKRTYDQPRTAYQRLLDHEAMDQSHAEALEATHRELNPAALTRRINAIPEPADQPGQDACTIR